MSYLTILYVGFTLALLPYFGLLGLVVTAALCAGRRPARQTPAGPARTPRFLIVIPAHDEEGHVAATVASCRALHYDPAAYRIVVVADNCTDDTARIARAEGAEVLERHDLERRSKGYALEYFFQARSECFSGSGHGDARDAVVVVDADTLVAPDLLDRFAQMMDEGVDWIQSYYSVSNPDASWRTRLLTYAFSLFNGVWLLGQDRLGISVGFRGNGMCFTARGLARVPWKVYGLVEDQEFSWVLRIAGERVRFLRETGVFGEMVSLGDAAVSQRQRWEEGRGSLPRRFARPLLASDALSPVQKGLALVELAFPPLMRLLALTLLSFTIYPVAYQLGNLGGLPLGLLALHAVMAATLALYAVSPFLAMRLPWRYLKALLAVPYFASWKIYVKFRARTRSWVRTRREPVTTDPRV